MKNKDEMLEVMNGMIKERILAEGIKQLLEQKENGVPVDVVASAVMGMTQADRILLITIGGNTGPAASGLSREGFDVMQTTALVMMMLKIIRDLKKAIADDELGEAALHMIEMYNTFDHEEVSLEA